jgi:DNA-directed RNA polymerase specialized sigma24 family protein
VRAVTRGFRRPVVEEVALVASSRRDLLLRAHAFRLRREDLEDAFSQATLELMQRAQRGGTFVDRRHIANTLEARFVSRIHDRRRALSGRSPIAAAMEGALRLAGPGASPVDPIDVRAELEPIVIRREELRRVLALAPRLTSDQRLVLASQLAWQMPPREFCRRFGWSAEKYRKVAQRGRRRLRWLMAVEEVEADERGMSRPPGAVGGERGTRL